MAADTLLGLRAAHPDEPPDWKVLETPMTDTNLRAALERLASRWGAEAKERAADPKASGASLLAAGVLDRVAAEVRAALASTTTDAELTVPQKAAAVAGLITRTVAATPPAALEAVARRLHEEQIGCEDHRGDDPSAARETHRDQAARLAPEPQITVELRRLSEAATPGPWEFEGLTGDGWALIGLTPEPESEVPERPYGYGEGVTWQRADAAFIVAAVNYVRAVIAGTAPEPQRTTPEPPR